MATVIAGMTMSLDGFVADPSGSVGDLYSDLADLRGSAYMNAAVAETGAVLMGRKTFEMGYPDSVCRQRARSAPEDRRPGCRTANQPQFPGRESRLGQPSRHLSTGPIFAPYFERDLLRLDLVEALFLFGASFLFGCRRSGSTLRPVERFHSS